MDGAHKAGKTVGRPAAPWAAGFTLVEILIVIVVLAILALIVVPEVRVTSDEARQRSVETNVQLVRRAVELYAAQHGGVYPADGIPARKPEDVRTPADVFVAQLVRFTDAEGNIANARSAVARFGPYLKGRALPVNAFNGLKDVVVDTTTTDITAASPGNTRCGWKFYAKTGVFLAGQAFATPDVAPGLPASAD